MIIKGIKTIKHEILKLADSGALYVVVGSFINKFVSFFGSVFLVRILTKTEYGILSYGENILGYFLICAGFGLSGGLLRYGVVTKDLSEKRAVYEFCVKTGTVISFIIALFGTVFFIFFPHPKEYSDYRLLFSISMLVVVFTHWINCGQNMLRALFENKKYAMLALIVSIILIIARLIGAYFGGLDGAIILRITTGAILGIVSVILVLRTVLKNAKKTKLTKSTKKEILSYSLQLMVTDGLWTIFMLNDVFLLGQLGASPIQIADYRTAYVIPGNLVILVSAIGTFVVPYFTKHEIDADYTWIQKNYRKVLICSITLVGTAVILCYMFGNQIIQFIYGEQYATCVPIMNVLLLASFFNCGIRYASANILTAMGQVKYNMRVSAICVFLQIGINAIVIPIYGTIGVAYTSVALYALMAIVMYCIFRNKYYGKAKNAEAKK